MSTPSGPPNDQSGSPQTGQPQPPGQQPPQPFGSPPENPPPGFDPYGTQQSQQQYAPYYRQMGGYYAKASNASTILILGIVGLVVCAPCGIAAWIMGKQTLTDMDRGQMDPRDRGMANAGMICGIIATVLMVLAFCAYAALFGFAFAAR